MLTPGDRLGPYEIVAPIGAGGMGEVFRARDTRLDRSVAIKVLPAEYARDTHFKLRFEREAKAISALNHPHICTLYDIGHENGTDYLVMELIEGESLADRVWKGPLPLDQIIRYGAQIAEALDRAHKSGIVHRDLKPGNVMLTKTGAKLLDFGLAKSNVTETLRDATTFAKEQKPLTREGTIIGTFQYMAPEQIEGEEADVRTDIFALGAVLYEMATGKRAFEGKTRTSLIAAIVTSQPRPISEIQPLTPHSLESVIATCLAKDPDERWQNARDVAIALRAIGSETPKASPRARSSFAWIAATVFAIMAAVLAFQVSRKAPAPRPIQTLILPPDGTTFDFRGFAAPPALSPDGKRIVFGAVTSGKARTLWIRSLDSLTAKELPGTENASFPFWSPDGRYVGFFTDTSLKKIDTTGGSPVVLCNFPDARGGTWSPDGRTIVFGNRGRGLSRVPAVGGAPVVFTKPVANETTHRWPVFLPDGKHLLYLASLSGGEDQTNTIYIGTLDGKVQKALVHSPDEPHYLAGYVLFVRDGILTAQKLDTTRLAMSGEPISLSQQQVATSNQLSRSIVSVAASGDLVYQTGEAIRNTQLTWLDRTGKLLGPLGESGPYEMVSLSPDGSRVAFTYGQSQPNIWLFDVTRAVRTRLTFGNDRQYGPGWSPDGNQLAYFRVEPPGMVIRNLDTGNERTALAMRANAASRSIAHWSPDGNLILFTEIGATTRGDIHWVSLVDGQRHPFLATDAIESNARFSPDGKWVAYQSSESGSSQIYLAPFPPTGAKWQVSTTTGVIPRFRGDGKELFYLTPAFDVMAVPIALTSPPALGLPVKLFAFRPGVIGNGGIYDVTRDGNRFLMNTRIGDEPPPPPLILVQNFATELRESE